jgi:hypothetical protein
VSKEIFDQYVTKDSGAHENLANGMVRDVEEGKTDYTLLLDGPLFERWAALLARGAAKYGPRNWTKALDSTDAAARAATTERFRRSAFRHMMQWLAGDRSEDHAAAVIFNLNGAEAMRDTDWRAGATPACERCAGTGCAPDAKREPKREPKFGDRVRITHGGKYTGRVGTLMRDRAVGQQWRVKLDGGPAVNGTVDVEGVEVLCEPKIGDIVRILDCPGAQSARNKTGELIQIDAKDYEMPWLVQLDTWEAWCTDVEIVP